jgi:glycosidase
MLYLGPNYPKKLRLFVISNFLPPLNQGEELVLTNIPISWEDTLDPQACNTNPQVYYEKSRDPARTPFPWDDSKNGDFSKADKTWPN